MKYMVISLFMIILFFIPLVRAIDFNFSSPSNASVGENFTVSLSSSSSEIYDVKIYLSDSDKIISEIFYNGWKSSFYYIKSSYPSISDYMVKAKLAGDWQLCVRLRKSDQSSYSQKCQSMQVTNSTSEDSSKQKKNQSPSNPKEDNANKKIEKETIQSSSKLNQSKSNSQNLSLSQQENYSHLQNSRINEEKIILSGKVSQSSNTEKESDYFKTKDEKVRLGIIYGFSIFTIIIVILLALRKL